MNQVDKLLSGAPVLVIAPHKRFYQDNALLNLVSMPFIYAMFFPIAFADIFIQIYQAIYFRIHDIPEIQRKEYFVFDRFKLKKLNLWQKFNCVYCEYANGAVAWGKDVLAQTEIYSCAIKHWHPAYKHPQPTQFYDPQLFDNNPKNDPEGRKTETVIAESAGLIIEKDKTITEAGFVANLFGGFSIYMLIFPLVTIDISLSVYQAVYFSIHQIPKLPRNKYLMLDRWRLPKLTWWQRIDCGYCEYANGVVAWAKDVIGQTEVYSCAIKHWHKAYHQDQQERFYEYKAFDSR